MNNKITKLLLATTIFLALYACKKTFLDVKPNGVLDEATLSSEKGVGKLLLSAYAMLDGHDGGLGLGGEWGSGGSNFLYGGMGGGEANKGSDPGDQGPNMTPVIRHDITSTNGAINDRWKALYEGVKRTNTVLEILAKVPAIGDASRKNLAGQARFLRAWYHFQARITYGKACFLDEATDVALATAAIAGVTNEKDIFPKIIEDAKYAYDNLPVTQNAVGRVNKYTAGAFYGKVLLFTKDFATAKTVLTDVVTNGKTPIGVAYDLNTRYEDNFNIAFENSKESVFAFQASSNDNAGARNGNWGDLLNLPATGPGGAGFYCPTYFFTNRFKTDAAGLPAADPENTQVLDPAGQTGLTQYAGNVDTRLDWTIGRNGVPYLDWGTYVTSWQRDPSAGPFGAKKTCIRQAQVGAYHDASIWYSAGGVALNINLIRFSDVLLLLAEAEVEVGSLTNAFALVNRVRNRAKNTTVVTFPATYGVPKTEPYAIPFETQAEARAAVRLERQLELGMEGGRFFDLVRWGIASTEINAFYAYENPLPYEVILNGVQPFVSPGRDYYPVPQQQIDLSHGFIKP